MIGYKDMTWCTFNHDCAKAKKCPRVLTEKVREDARKWWGNAEAPIIQFYQQPECHVKVEKHE